MVTGMPYLLMIQHVMTLSTLFRIKVTKKLHLLIAVNDPFYYYSTDP